METVSSCWIREQVIDVKKDDIAVHEAKKLDIPVFAIVDTNCDPDRINYPIPGNDDSYKSIEFITRVISDAIMEVTTTTEKEELVEEPEPQTA